MWSPAEFTDQPDTRTHRGLNNITRLTGIWFDVEDSALNSIGIRHVLSTLAMVIYNSASSTNESPRFRIVIPTTCYLTPDVHREITAQVADSLRRRGYYSKLQLVKGYRAKKEIKPALNSLPPEEREAAWEAHWTDILA